MTRPDVDIAAAVELARSYPRPNQGLSRARLDADLLARALIALADERATVEKQRDANAASLAALLRESPPYVLAMAQGGWTDARKVVEQSTVEAIAAWLDAGDSETRSIAALVRSGAWRLP